ncbi:MAG: response regulator [Thermoanaerobaculia bacterium]|nr:response regulator [Thermoanaerobaculia bacterium]
MRTTRILIADDEYSTRMTVRYRLALEKGLHVATATGGWEALRLVRTLRPDILLLGASMSGQAGICISQAIRSDEKSHGHQRSIQIFLLKDRGMESGRDDEATAPETRYVDAILYRPFDLERLAQRILVLARHPAEGSARSRTGQPRTTLGESLPL